MSCESMCFLQVFPKMNFDVIVLSPCVVHTVRHVVDEDSDVDDVDDDDDDAQCRCRW